MFKVYPETANEAVNWKGFAPKITSDWADTAAFDEQVLPPSIISQDIKEQSAGFGCVKMSWYVEATVTGKVEVYGYVTDAGRPASTRAP